MRAALAIALSLTIAACSSTPDKEFRAASFTKESVVMATVLDLGTGRTERMDKARLADFLDAMHGIAPLRRENIEAEHEVTLYSGSSFDSQEMTVSIGEGGKGCFRRGGGKRVMFLAPRLDGFPDWK